MLELGFWGIIAVLLYLGAVGYLGYRGYRDTKTTADYMVAGRGTHPYVMAMSYGATFISTSAIIGFGGAAALFGMSLLWLCVLNIAVGIFLAFVVFGGRTRRMGHTLDAHTFPELMGRRFESRFIQGFSGLVIFIGMPLYTSVVIMGVSSYIKQALGVNYDAALLLFGAVVALYVIMGGLKGVMYTDALQGSIMLVGMLLLLVMTYAKVGGVVGGHTALTNLAESGHPLAKLGLPGWTVMPQFGSRVWWVAVSTIIMGVGIGVLAQPQLAVRYMTVRSQRELNRAVLIGGIFILVTIGTCYVVGPLSNLYFVGNPDFGKISIAAAAGNVNEIMPLYIGNAMPHWFVVLFLMTLFAAAMSTVSSQFHTMGTSIGRDLYEKGCANAEHSSRTIGVTRVGIGVAFVVAVFLAWWLPRRFGGQGAAVIARGTAIFFGMCAAAFLPMYFGALFTRRCTRAGAAAGMSVGFVTSLFWLFFCQAHLKGFSATPILCEKLFGRPSLMQRAVETVAEDGAVVVQWVPRTTGWIIWDVVDPLFVALPLAIIVTIIVSLATQPPSKEHLDRCFAP